MAKTISTTDITAVALHLGSLAPFGNTNFSGRTGNADTEGMGSHIIGWGEHIQESAAAAIYSVYSYDTVIAWTANGTDWTILAQNPGHNTTGKQMSAVRRAVESLEGRTLTAISKTA